MRLRGETTAAAVVVLLFAVAGCKEQGTGTGTGSAGPEGTGSGGGAALTAADSLTAKGRAPKTGYARERFGTAWADTDSHSCDTRVISVLRRVIGTFTQLTQGVVSCAC